VETPARDGAGEVRVQSLDVAIEARRILEGVTMEAGRGSLVGLLGPNGSGKTTLLRAINGFLRPSGGAVFFEDRDLHALSPREVAQAVARIPQSTGLDFSFTARETALMGRHPHLGRFAMEGDEDERLAAQALETVGMGAFADRRVDTLSGGERQLVLIARALAQRPRLLLLDEPTASLDIAHQVQVMDLVKSLVDGGVTAIAALHDLSLAAAYCTRVVLLSHGRVMAQGAPAEVLTTQNIRAVFNVWASIHPDPVSGRLVVAASQPGQTTPHPARVHVIAGGGSGAPVIAMLARAGHRVTVGVLNEGDTDLATARALGLEVVAGPPFAAIDDERHRRNVELARQADVVVLADVPFGLANLRNLEAASAARRLVTVDGTPWASRDFTGGIASALWTQLSTRAVVTSREGLDEAIGRLLAEEPSRGRGKDGAPAR
jgi:iron complex transport system ATP-binding protein